MKLQHIAISAGVIGFSVLALAFGKGTCTTAPAAAAEPQQAPASQAPDMHPEPKRFGEHTTMIAPLFVTLEKGATDAGGETEIIVHIKTNDVIRYPVSIEVTPPVRDGVLTQGLRLEAIDLSQGGNLDRSFKVKAPSGLESSANAFKVVVKGGNDKLGFYAEKQYPPAAEMTVPARLGPMPPSGRPPLRAPIPAKIAVPG